MLEWTGPIHHSQPRVTFGDRSSGFGLRR